MRSRPLFKMNSGEISFTPDVCLNDRNEESHFSRKINTCEIVDNRIYFYSEIDRENVLELNKNLRSVSNDLVARRITEGSESGEIFLHINSDGGIISDAMSSMDEILNSKIPVNTIIDGCCMSAATFLSIAGKKRFINRHAFIMIHQLSTGFWGDFDFLQDQMRNTELIMNLVKKTYRSYTKITEEKLDYLMEKELYLLPEEAVELGFVDEIIG